MVSIPSREMTTVPPANRTARPAVPMAVILASRGDIPLARPWR